MISLTRHRAMDKYSTRILMALFITVIVAVIFADGVSGCIEWGDDCNINGTGEACCDGKYCGEWDDDVYICLRP